MPTLTQQEILEQSNKLNAGHVNQHKDLIPKHIEANCKLNWKVHRGNDQINAVIMLAAGWIDWPRFDEMLKEANDNGRRDNVAVCCVDRVWEMMPAERRSAIDYVFGADMFGRPMAKAPKKNRNPVFVFESRANPEQIQKWQHPKELVITRDSTFYSENELLWQIASRVGDKRGGMPHLIACAGNAGTMAMSCIGHYWHGFQQMYFFGHDFCYWACDPECGNERVHRGPRLKGCMHTAAYAYTKPDYWFFKDWTERFCRDATIQMANKGRKVQFVSMSIGLLGRNENGYPIENPEHLMLAGINADLQECLKNVEAGGDHESDKYRIERVTSDPPSARGQRYSATWPVNITSKIDSYDPQSGCMGVWTNEQSIQEKVKQKAGRIDFEEGKRKIAAAAK